MVREINSTDYGDLIDERFNSVLNGLTGIKNFYVLRSKDRSKKHSSLPRLLFHIAGLLTIILSISIPCLVSINDKKDLWAKTVVPIIALVIAALTGLSSFYQGQSTWIGYRKVQFNLDHPLSIWDLKIVEAKYCIDIQEGIKIAQHAIEQLLNEARKVTFTGTEKYF